MKSIVDKIKEEKERERLLSTAIISLKDFLAKDLPPNKWIVEGLIPEGMTILSSSPGQFKTYLLLALIRQISNGELGFNHFKTEKRIILFVNEEMGERALQDRLKSISGEAQELYFTNLAGIKLNDISLLLELCKEKGVTLVIFDSLTRIHNLKENDADDVKKIFEAMLLLLKNGISVIMTHHHRKASMFGAKNGSEEMRGSTDLLAQTDCHLAIDIVAKNKSYLVIKQQKIRIAENLPDFRIDIKKEENDKISFIYRGEFTKEDELKNRIAENKEAVLKIIFENPGITKEEVKEKTNGRIGQMAIQAILTELEKEGFLYCKTNRPKTYYIKDEIKTLF